MLHNVRAFVGVFLLCLGGCATPPQTSIVLNLPSETLPRHVELSEVPFFSQQAYQCGPASLAMVLSAVGEAVTPEILKPELYLPDEHGSLQVEMLATARRHSVLPYKLSPSLENLMRELDAGNPVIVLQNLAFSWYPVWHYAVVIGYDIDQAEIILRSGHESREILPMRTFEYTWARSDYWAMVLMPSGKLPVTADPISFISELSALERLSGPEHVHPSYFAALVRWPSNLAVQIGSGNNAYRLHRLDQAEAIFRLASKDHPESVAAFNNLAQTLEDQGRLDEALQAARHAVSLDGALAPTAKQTLGDIERHLGR